MSETLHYMIPLNRNTEQSEGDNENEVPVGGHDF